MSKFNYSLCTSRVLSTWVQSNDKFSFQGRYESMPPIKVLDIISWCKENITVIDEVYDPNSWFLVIYSQYCHPMKFQNVQKLGEFTKTSPLLFGDEVIDIMITIPKTHDRMLFKLMWG